MPAPNWLVWPNDYVASDIYSTAELEVARAYFDHHQLAEMRQALNNELRIYPTDQIARDDLAKLNQTQSTG